MKTYTKDIVTIGQCWQRKRGGCILKVRNIYRHEQSLLVLDERGERDIISFRELRKYYRLL